MAVHESAMTYNMFTTIYFIFGFNDTTSDCVTINANSNVSDRDKESIAFLTDSLSLSFTNSFFVPFISVTIVIIQYESLHS